MKKLFLTFAITMASTLSLQADDMQQSMQSYLTGNIANWANDPVLVAAIDAQNKETSGYDQARIDELDQLWRAFAGAQEAEIIANVVANPAADFLRSQIEQSDGAITEAFIVDARGLNVAATNPTSDYWQGDEEKFTRTYLVGQDAVHFGEIELDASTNEVQGQVSMTIINPDTGQPVGAITVGVNLAALM